MTSQQITEGKRKLEVRGKTQRTCFEIPTIEDVVDITANGGGKAQESPANDMF